MPSTRGPLSGRRIVVTRPAAQAEEFRAPLEALGAEVLLLALTRIERLDPARLQDALARLDSFDWLVVTSRNAVDVLLEEVERAGIPVTALARLRLAAVGPSTADALREADLEVTLVPDNHRAEGLADALSEREIRGARVLYPMAEGAREALVPALRALGAAVEAIPVYRSATVPVDVEEVRTRLRDGTVDLLTFTAPSAVHAYAKVVGDDDACRIPGISIGPVTSEAMRRAGIVVTAEARESTIVGLVAAVLEWAGSHPESDVIP